MHKIMLASLAAVSLFSVTGCKKSGGGDMLAKMEGFQKSMCECKDKACADKVAADMTKWSTDSAKDMKADDKPDPDMAKKSADIMTKYGECMTKLSMAAATPPTDDKMAKPDMAKPDDKMAKPDDKMAKPDDKKPDDKKAGGW